MTGFMLAAMLGAAHPTPPPAPAVPPTVRLILVDEQWHELVAIDRAGVPQILRWCTPWEVAEAWLASRRR